MKISNDSLLHKFENEQIKVQRLQEELRTVKATNTKRINELTKELEVLRNLLKHYIQQIDSLDKINTKLTTENKQITSRLNQTNQRLNQVTKEKEQLGEIVQLASKLTASNITVKGLNDKNKQTNQIKNLQKIQFDFLVSKNVTATPGEKTIYIRIMEPNDDVLIISPNNVFTYEDREINYSEKRNIEYEGEELHVTIYYNIGKFLSPGTYSVAIFADGNRIGLKSFKLDK